MSGSQKKGFNLEKPKKMLEKIKFHSLGKKTSRTLIILFLLGLLTFAITPQSIIAKYPKEGEFSQKTIKAPYDFNYKDMNATLIKQKESVALVNPIYILDLTLIASTLEKVNNFFDQIEKIKEQRNFKLEDAVETIKEKINLDNETIEVMLMHPQLFEMESDVTSILRTCLVYGITDVSQEQLKADIQKGIKLNIVSKDSSSEKIVNSMDNIFFISQVPLTSSLYPKLISTSKAKEAVFKIVNAFLQPNLIFNQKKTDKAIKDVVKQVKTIMVAVSKGEKIVGDGERVDATAEIKLREIYHRKTTSNINIIIGSLILLYILMGYTLFYLYRYYHNILILNKNLILVGLIIVITIGITKVTLSFNWPLYTIPVAAFSMILAIMLNQSIAIFVTCSLSILIGMLTKADLSLVFFFLSGGLSAIYCIPLVRMRSDMIKPGLVISIVQGLVILGYGLIDKESFWMNLFWGSIVNGVVSTMLAMGILPYLERIFNITTNFRLFELSDLNSPVLKSLLMKAPGTYHHSILVANLAESAAETVLANSLLARVASYYHDIGKMNRPEYFVENQIDNDSKHSMIKTSLSVSILKSHIKEGVEMGKKYNLPSNVVDIIQEHHGDSLMVYFYHQAKQEHPDNEEPNKLDFSYPGPKPQTKEAAIIMLADAVEAASRSLAKPTPVRIESLVKKIINNKFIDGELDDCDLTLMDLNKIATVFTRSLSTIFHSRVEYPEEREDVKDEAEDKGISQ